LNSATRVAATARLVDLRTGKELWAGSAVEAVNSNDGKSSILSTLINAAVTQISNNINDKSHSIAGFAAGSLFRPSIDGESGGIMYGPRSPMYIQSKI